MRGEKQLGLQNVFILGVGLLFGLLGALKLHAFTMPTSFGDEPDLILPLSRRGVMLVAGFTEVAVAIYLLTGRIPWLKHMLILWLGLNLMLYRLGTWVLAADRSCPCLGTIVGQLAGKEKTVDRVLEALLGIMVVGSGFFLLRGPVVRGYATMTNRGRRWINRGLGMAVVLALIPALQVGYVAVFDPPTTGPMMLNTVKARFSGNKHCPNRFIWIPLRETPEHGLKILVAAEDFIFFRHRGFDWEQIRLALREALVTGSPPHGASTITQQCARSLFLWQGRSWIRKGLEAYYTFWMEVLLGKRRILELYVNVIELGPGIFGLEAAARTYYGKSARDLSEPEVALLAAILPAPKRWSLLEPSEHVKHRQQLILSRMQEVQLPWETSTRASRSERF